MKRDCTSNRFRVEEASLAVARELWELPHPEGFFRIADGGQFEIFERNVMGSFLIVRYPFGYVRVEKMNRGHVLMIARVHGVFHDVPMMVKNDVRSDLLDGVVFLLNAYRDLQRIECVVPERSRSLKRLLLSVGFNMEGVLRSWYRFSDGSIMDAAMFSFVR